MLFAVLIFGFTHNAFAQTLGFGHCPDVDVASAFNMSKFSGLWYENQRSKPNIHEMNVKCVTINHTLIDNNSMKIVVHTVSEISDTESEIIAYADIDADGCENSSHCGKLAYQFPIGIAGHDYRNIWVIDTDYTSYNVMWSCINYLFFHLKYLWVFTREANPPKSTLELIDNVILKNGIDNLPMSFTNQLDCPSKISN